ncbi:MAG TPA: carboxypeptidase-like regulatory domain-containing protein, partial [Kofleriaceae bacterium]
MKPAPFMLVLAVALAGCAFGAEPVGSPPADADGGDLPPGPDGNDGCNVTLSFTPPLPLAKPSEVITVQSHVFNAPGTIEYHWHVDFFGTEITPRFQNGNTEIVFPTPQPGVYLVSLTITGSSKFCPSASVPINVGAVGARTERVRLHIVAPASSDALALDRIQTISGGADLDLGFSTLARGMRMSKVVSGPNGPLAAYLRFVPTLMPEAVIEAFSNSDGQTSVVLDQDSLYTVLVVPSVGGAAPRRIINWSPGNPFVVADAGTPVSGEGRDPAGAAIEGAKVQLTIDGVPSTLATTAADGSFQLRAPSAIGAITVEVAAPESSGLPRLSATSSAFDLGARMVVRYAASLARRDLSGTRVLRDAAPVGGARVTVVGPLTGVGRITTTGAPVDGTGEVRITATADGAGALPAMLVPAATLSAVIEVAPGDLAVAALDTSSAAPASLDAPAMPVIATTVVNQQQNALPGTVLDLVPLGALAVAGAPVLHLTADGQGAVRGAVAAGGHYDL